MRASGALVPAGFQRSIALPVAHSVSASLALRTSLEASRMRAGSRMRGWKVRDPIRSPSSTGIRSNGRILKTAKKGAATRAKTSTFWTSESGRRALPKAGGGAHADPGGAHGGSAVAVAVALPAALAALAAAGAGR